MEGTMAWTAEEQKQHRKLWVEALRSGKYEQARQRLRVENSMCCLGVACDISGLGHWHPAGDEDGVIVDYITLRDQRRNDLPQEVQDWLGLAGEEGQYETNGDLVDSLAGDNDAG